MSRPTSQYSDGAALNSAAIWHARLNGRTCDEQTWTEFTVWLESDGANRIAFDLVTDLYDDLDEAGAMSPLLVQSEMASRAEGGAPWRRARGLQLGAAAAGLAALAATVAVALITRHPLIAPAERYATHVGETRTVSLADGSMVEMNTDSTIAVRLGRAERRVELEHGEVIFRVSRDPARPFIVTVADREIRDIGTVFNVFKSERRLVVTVAEGKVAISPHAAAGRPAAGNGGAIDVVAGYQLVAQDGADKSAIVRQVEPNSAMSWRRGYLTYNDAPLSSVIDDLNRYFPNRIILKDRETGSSRFSGVLQIGNEDIVLKRLTQLLPLVIDHADNGSVVLHLRPRAE